MTPSYWHDSNRRNCALPGQPAKKTLLRRVSFDLTGLPPTLEDLDAFLNDTAPDAYERVVDRLLDAPAYGERWAWEWLDVARYADTNGFQADPTRTMWPWRDWVVQAFNDNMPFDRFTVEQLAGDLLPDATQRQVLATGFNRNHMYNGEGGRVPEETRVENVFDRVETMGTAWLGLTLNCSRCHDHKYDPITQHEYFQFYDYFNQTSEDGGLYGNGQVPPILDLAAPGAREAAKAAADVFNAHARDVTEAEKHLFPRAEGLLPGDSPRAAPLHNRQTLQARAKSRNRASLTFLADEMEEAEPAYATQLRELAAAKAALDHAREQDVRVMIMDHLEEPRKTFVLDRGTYDKPTTLKATADVPAFLPPLPDQAPANRFALAQWIVAPNNPLTARVTVNRYWQAFFGAGLVKTTEDFGLQGEQPSHPDLLDWLAVAFMESGWDLKALHKRIVMSATYRQSAVITPALLEVDPDNRWLARGPRHRLPSWMIRDLALASSGLLVDTLGGPSVKPYQPDGIWNEATFGIIQYDQDQGDKLYRRTLYTFWRRIVGPTMLFDNAPRQVCSVKPPLTNSPMHALTTLNDIAYVEAARVMAARVMQMEADETERIRTAFRIVTSRWPTAEEQSILTERLEKLRQQYGASPNEALKIIAVGESPSNPNLDPVEHAAFTGLCSLLLNLDETITKQ